MAYGIYYESYEDMSLKKYEKLKLNLIQKEGCQMETPVNIRKITYQNPEKSRKSEEKVAYQILMKNRDEAHLHLVARMESQGQICKKVIWLLKEDCMKILQGDIEWMKDAEEAVLYDFYYQIVNGGYKPVKMTESVSQAFDFPKRNNTILLETSRKNSELPTTEFFSEDWQGKQQLKAGRVRVTYQRKHTFPEIEMESLNLKSLEIQYV